MLGNRSLSPSFLFMVNLQHASASWREAFQNYIHNFIIVQGKQAILKRLYCQRKRGNESNWNPTDHEKALDDKGYRNAKRGFC